MHFLRITVDSSRAELAEAVTHLRKRHLNESDAVVRGWIEEDIDDLLDMYRLARSAGVGSIPQDLAAAAQKPAS